MPCSIWHGILWSCFWISISERRCSITCWCNSVLFILPLCFLFHHFLNYLEEKGVYWFRYNQSFYDDSYTSSIGCIFDLKRKVKNWDYILRLYSIVSSLLAILVVSGAFKLSDNQKKQIELEQNNRMLQSLIEEKANQQNWLKKQ